MLISCNACGAINVVEFEVQRGDAHCIDCSEVIEDPRTTDEPFSGMNAALEDDSVYGVYEEKTPLMPIYSIRKMIEESCGKIPAAPMWGESEETTLPELLRIDSLIDSLLDKPLDLKKRVEKGADDFEFDFGARVEKDQRTDRIERAADSQNVPMVFERATRSSVTARHASPRKKKRDVSFLIAWAVVVGLLAVDVMVTRPDARRHAMAAANGSNPAQAAPAAPQVPSQNEAPQIESTSAEVPQAIQTIDIENLPAALVQPSPVTHDSTSTTTPKRTATEGELLGESANLALERRDFASARAGYAHALATNPYYLPAKVGLADVAWAMGDRAKAKESYRALTESYPDRLLPVRVFQRAEVH